MQVTDSGGTYEFRRLAPGRYLLEINAGTLPPDFRLPAQTSWLVEVEPLQGFYRDLPLAAQRCTSGFVFIDTNGDGQFDPEQDEAVAGGRVVCGQAEAITDSHGAYLLRRLPAGKLELRARTPWASESAPVAVELGAAPSLARGVNLAVTH